MDAVAATLEGFALAEWLRYSRWGYAAVSATHILGITLLVGAATTLDLRLLGLWRSVESRPLYRILSSVAAVGLAAAIASGVLLFSVRAAEYAALQLFQFKIALIALGSALAAGLHFGLDPTRLPRARRRLAASVSLLLWITVLLCGRLLAFVG